MRHNKKIESSRDVQASGPCLHAGQWVRCARGAWVSLFEALKLLTLAVET
jgi:hypothetical protein